MATFIRILKTNWYLAGLMAFLLSAAVFVYAFPKEEREGEAKSMQVLVLAEPIVVSKAAVDRHAVRPTAQEAAQKEIADLQGRFDQDPKSPDAPAMLNAMASLNRQKLLNYEEAARLYELLLLDYAEWEGCAWAYSELATCYQRMGRPDLERGVYRRMMEKFAPDTQEHLFAKDQLGL